MNTSNIDNTETDKVNSNGITFNEYLANRRFDPKCDLTEVEWERQLRDNWESDGKDEVNAKGVTLDEYLQQYPYPDNASFTEDDWNASMHDQWRDDGAEPEIDVPSFRREWNKIKSKLDQIANIPKLGGWSTSEHFHSLLIDDDGITYYTREWSHGEDDNNEFTIHWDELNKPLSYFEKMYGDQIKHNELAKQAQAQHTSELQEQTERHLYLKLRDKFERK